MSDPYGKRCYLALALDPIHVGTGGYRLGRVDNTIVREPGTNLPKVPGTSISGVVRSYTAMQVNRYPGCAGKGGTEGEDHCGGCAVCLTYGFSKGRQKKSFQGLAQFFDARIAFFPVRSMKGPVWVTCPSVLSDLAGSLGSNGVSIDGPWSVPEDKLQTSWVAKDARLNLGWLHLQNSAQSKPVASPLAGLPQEIFDRLVLISDRIFTHVVNDNLEVRTSVAIDPQTGAHEEGALFSYEAIPRATVLWFDVVFNKPELFLPPSLDGSKDNKYSAQISAELNKEPAGKQWLWVKQNVEMGLQLLEVLGVGGMGTRGMGRMRVIKMPDGSAQPNSGQSPKEKAHDQP